ncbi:LysM peptidoglycan-binding domain-containing protein [Melittangium boletus]|uniref:LysM peptidoglycan-binding domain-containing protein n=1 Tax=Melittangium boletus TaxID=83453 RepID=UPI001FE6283E|nr:LysM peptidoglycan-binding domain-containing protein [Melittangium boletus]
MLKIPKEPAPSPRLSSQPAMYRVRAGDTLSAIAQRNNTTVEALTLANHLKDPDRLAIGQVLKIPKEHPPTSQAQAKNAKAPSTREPGTKTSNELLFENGKEIGSFGRVSIDEGVNLRAAPGGAILKWLPFNTRVFVSREYPGDCYFVTLDDGSFGYVHSKYVSINPPEPGAVLYKIKKDEGALQIVKKHYKGSAISWGQDERYYVNVLVEANRGKNPSGIYKPYEGADWSKTQTRETFLIWVPTLDFAKSLRGKVSSGSISYEAWQAAKSTASAVGDFYLAYSAFVAGLIHGALESIWDLLTGLVDLIKLIWDILKSIFTKELFSDLKSLWELVQSLKPSQLIDAGINVFLSRWNAPDFLRRWLFRGWVVGYAIAEILMAVVSGAATLVKWAGKAGKFSKLIAKLPKVLKLAEKVTEATKRIPEESLKRIKKVVSRTPDEAPPRRKDHIPWTGARYAEDVDPGDAKLYEKIRNAVDDTLDIAKNLKLKQSVLDKVKDHLFHRVHELPIEPNKTIKANFSPDPDIADLWTKAMKGKLPLDEAKRFLRLMAHEYVESRLMEKGLPYRSSHPDAYKFGYNMPTPKHHGAHDLAPIVDAAREPFGHWEKMLGRKPPKFEFASDLSNLDELVELIWKGSKG